MKKISLLPAYKRICDEERELISIFHSMGIGVNEISRRIGRHPSSILREIKRNTDSQGNHRCLYAAKLAIKRASIKRLGKRKILQRLRLKKYVESKIINRFSPQQISNRLKLIFKRDSLMKISHEAIYQYLYTMPKRELKTLLLKELRRKHKYRRGLKRRQSTPRPLEDMVLIDERPKEIEKRIVPGHWEGDLIIGKNRQSALGVLLERKTRFTLLVPLKDRKAETIRKEFGKAIIKLPKELRKTLTYDQGREMAEHKGLTLDTGIKVFFAHPASPWEKGSTENTNGLLRQYFPKGTDFNKIETKEIRFAQRQLNERPRAVLKYYTPSEVFKSLLR